MGLWVASTSSLRYTRPGAIMRMGRGSVSMARTCMGLVWERSITLLSSLK